MGRSTPGQERWAGLHYSNTPALRFAKRHEQDGRTVARADCAAECKPGFPAGKTSARRGATRSEVFGGDGGTGRFGGCTSTGFSRTAESPGAAFAKRKGAPACPAGAAFGHGERRRWPIHTAPRRREAFRPRRLRHQGVGGGDAERAV